MESLVQAARIGSAIGYNLGGSHRPSQEATQEFCRPQEVQSRKALTAFSFGGTKLKKTDVLRAKLQGIMPRNSFQFEGMRFGPMRLRRFGGV